LPGKKLELLLKMIFAMQKLAGDPLTNAGYQQAGRAERYSIAITNVLEGIHESEKIGGADGVLEVVKEFIDEDDAGSVTEQAGPDS
jgi:hypothetical protein